MSADTMSTRRATGGPAVAASPADTGSGAGPVLFDGRTRGHPTTLLTQGFRALGVLAWVAQREARGADVLSPVPGRHCRMPLAGQRGQKRRDIAGHGTDRKVHVFERPLEREIGREVALIHLVELG